MTPRISLALAIHNHQPVGNFGWVFAEVFERAYEPLVAALERHPTVRLSLHYTGPLLDWTRAERPDFIDRLRLLVRRGQVELMGGGYYEPVLASLPERDRVGQLRRMADEIEASFAVRPSGAWLAERVWEPDLPRSLAAGGYAWTILDDAHFRAAAIPEEDLWGPYTTDDQGALLTVFGTEQGLRYLIPFREVDEVIEHLRAHATDAGDRLGTMGDDGEKFGAWPTTWEHCWGRGRWMERFFDALERNASWLSTTTPSDWLAAHRPVGRVYIPTGSYVEMTEWALPPDESRRFSQVLHRAIEEDRPEARFLHGGFWRNFQVRYREINDLHKQMLRASAKVDAMPDGPAKARAVDHLYQGQSNDCFWHGLFGGIYISHMRLATYEHLIAAEDLADAALGRWSRAERTDLDLDGRAEVLLETTGQVVSLKPDEGAGIGSWDVRAPRHALTAVLRRRPEASHERLRAHEAGAASGGDDEPEGTTSIHEIVHSKEPDLAAHLVYDDHERRSGLVRFLEPGTAPDDVAAARERELGDFVAGPFEVVELEEGRVVVARDGAVTTPRGTQAVRVVKTVVLGGDRPAPTLRLDVDVENRSGATLDALLAVEWSMTMLGGGGNPSAWWEAGGERVGHDTAGAIARATTIAQGNDYVGVSVCTELRPEAAAWWYPIDTVSMSEAGFERVYQGSCLLLSWPIHLRSGERMRVTVDHVVSTTRDRAADEAAAAATEP